MTTNGDQPEGKPASWAADRPGETPDQAKGRAHSTIRKAAAAGNPTAREMAKKLPSKKPANGTGKPGRKAK